MASLGVLNMLTHSQRGTMAASLDGTDEVVTKNLEQHVRDGIQALNERNWNDTQYPWTGAAEKFRTINPTGGRPPAHSKLESMAIMQQICEAFPEHQLRIESLSTRIFNKHDGRYAEVFMNAEVSGAPGLEKGVWRPMVTVWTYQRINGEWLCVSEESIDGLGAGGDMAAP